MVKPFIYIVFGALILIVFFTPARNYMNNIFLRDKAQFKEEQIIGTVSGYKSACGRNTENLERRAF